MRDVPKQSDDLHREGEPSQETEKGLKIPIPKRNDFDRFLEGVRRTAKKPGRRGKPSLADPDKL